MNDSLLFISIFIIIILTSFGIISLFVTFNNRKNQLLHEKLEDQLAAQKRQHNSELNALRSQLNPHFVHNSLNAIQYYIQRNEVEISEDYLTKFSKLMRLFFDYSRKKLITLDEEVIFLTKYLQIEKLRYENKVTYGIEIDEELDLEEYVIPTMILQPILENAVNHGVFHKAGTGHIMVRFEKQSTEDSYKVSIIDNGIGFKKSKELQKSQKASTKAHSSEVIKERLDILNEGKEWNIDYKILDRSETSSKSGTAVFITFKHHIE
jgi:two-component system LytT family sensor kinase